MDEPFLKTFFLSTFMTSRDSISQLGCSFGQFLSYPIMACIKRIDIVFRDIFIRPSAPNSTGPSHSGKKLRNVYGRFLKKKNERSCPTTDGDV